jgi:tRNA-modifying protein YgfZ
MGRRHTHLVCQNSPQAATETKGKTTVNFMRVACISCPLEELGVLRARGADVVSFLQGQLSSDVTLLAPQRSVFAGYHNPQGRVVALLRLVQLAPDEVLGVLPRELVAPLISRLAKYILRARVKLTDDSASWNITGLIAGDEAAGAAGTCDDAPLPEAPGMAARVDGSIAVRLPGQAARWLLIGPATATHALPQPEPAPAGLWERLAVGAGEPQVYAATSEEFVAQMLNLDLLGAVSFDKGCYIGQEVIARAHYRGRVKRRMQRFVSRAPLVLRPGAAGALADGRAFRVVQAAALADGRCEFLAVAPLSGATEENPPEAATRVAGAAVGGSPPLDVVPLALPYPLPA